MRTFFPLKDDGIVVHARTDGRIHVVIGRALVNLAQEEAKALADCLNRATEAAQSPAEPAPAVPKQEAAPRRTLAPPRTYPQPPEIVTQIAFDSWQQWWNDYTGPRDDTALRASLGYVVATAGPLLPKETAA